MFRIKTNPILRAALVALGWAVFRDLFSSIPLTDALFEALEIIGCYLALDEARHRFSATSLAPTEHTARLPIASPQPPATACGSG